MPDRLDRLPTSRRTLPAFLYVAFISAAILLSYANSFPGGFFFDDGAAIVQNTSIRNLWDLRSVLWPPVEAGIGGRPFGNLTLALNYAFGGLDPAGYHAVNLAIHLGTALLLFALVRHTLSQPRLGLSSRANAIALVLTLLWALHPVHTNIVDYLSQRTEGLMALLYLLTLYAFARSVAGRDAFAADGPVPRPLQRGRGWAVVAVTASALGMATKEGMVTVPAMVWLYDRTFLSGSFGIAWRRHAALLLAIASTWLLLAALMATSKLSARGVGLDLDQSPFWYAVTECRAICRYLQLSFWPHPLVFDYGTAFYLKEFTAALPYIAALGGALAFTGVALRRWPLVGFGAAWFFVLLSPSSSVIPVVQQPCAENRMYLPLAGITLLIVAGAYRVGGRMGLAAVAVAALGLGVATHARNPAFANELSIWSDTVQRRPANARARNNLGNALLKIGRADDAMPHLQKALELSPNYADAHNNLGVTFLRQQRPEDAAAEFKRAIETKARYGDAYYNLGEAYLQLGRDADAVEPLRTAIEINPDNPKAHNNLGIALLNLGRVEESVREERTALQLNPNMPEAHYNLGNSLARAGQPVEALAEYDATLALDPAFAKAHNNAGVVLLKQNKPAEAAVRFARALQINPNYPEARRNLELVRGPLPASPATPPAP